MTINGINYRLTKHGRKRYMERHGYFYLDADILLDCVNGHASSFAIWKPDKREGFRLVTVLPYRYKNIDKISKM